jgi:hypothetical protein
VNTTAFRETQAEVVAVSNFLASRLGHGMRIPIEWKSFAEHIRHELQKLGWFDLADDVVAENDGITLRWTRLDVEGISGGNYTFVLDQTLAQKAKEAEP